MALFAHVWDVSRFCRACYSFLKLTNKSYICSTIKIYCLYFSTAELQFIQTWPILQFAILQNVSYRPLSAIFKHICPADTQTVNFHYILGEIRHVAKKLIIFFRDLRPDLDKKTPTYARWRLHGWLNSLEVFLTVDRCCSCS